MPGRTWPSLASLRASETVSPVAMLATGAYSLFQRLHVRELSTT
jgi:hypothetical protein